MDEAAPDGAPGTRRGVSLKDDIAASAARMADEPEPPPVVEVVRRGGAGAALFSASLRRRALAIREDEELITFIATCLPIGNNDRH